MSKSFLRFDTLLEISSGFSRLKARVKGLGKSTTVYVIFPYGMISSPPPGELCTSWQMSGQESDRGTIINDPFNVDISSNEVVFYNPTNGTEIRLKASGDVDITGPNVNIFGDLHVTGTSVTHNGTNIGATHVHEQGNDSNGDSEVDTDGPK